MKYFNIIDFRNKLYKIKHDLIENVLVKSPKELSGIKLSHRDVRVTFEFYKDDEKVNDIYHSSLQEIILKEGTPNIYQVIQDSIITNGKEVLITVVFNVEEVIYQDKDVLGIKDEVYTFHTYEEFMKFVALRLRKKYHINRDNLDIYLCDRKTNIVLSCVFESKVGKQKGLIPIESSVLNLYGSYKKLRESHKKQVDEILCPITIKREDVQC